MRSLALKFEAIMFRRGFVPVAILIFVALVAVLGGGGALAWRTTVLDPYLPAPVREFLGRGGVTSGSSGTSTENSKESKDDQTKDWKTYTNEEFGFSFKYPRDWKFKDLGDGWLVFGPRADEFQTERLRPQLEFGGFGGDYGYNIGFAPEDDAWSIEEKSVIVAGKSATRTAHTYKPDGEVKIVRVKFIESPHTKFIEFYPLKSDFNVFDLILVSFKFI